MKVRNKFQRKLTADWSNEIQPHLRDVVKHQLAKQELLNQQACKRIEKPKETFCTGSTYEGHWDSLGFAGYGTYVYPHGAKYRGNFLGGQFHGDGTIIYPGGQKFTGTWNHGKLVNHSYQFVDGLMYEKNFAYCQLPDRRFQLEKKTRLHPAGEELLTNQPSCRKLPKNCYDTVDGYYNPKTKIVYGYDNHVMRVVTVEEDEHIRKTSRQQTKRPDSMEGMFTYWSSGRKHEVEKLEEMVKKVGRNFDKIPFPGHIGKI